MLRISPLVVVQAFLLAAAPPLLGQPITSSVPQHGPSLYVQTAGGTAASGPQGRAAHVALASHEEPRGTKATASDAPPALPIADDARRLRRSNHSIASKKQVDPTRPSSPFRLPAPGGSMATTIAALSLVSGLLLLALWGLKRSMPQSSQMLPAEVGGVLGRMPLVAKHYAHLIKLGDKLVLVSISPTSVDTLTEITDQDQVTRLVALCSQRDPQSATKSFEAILQELSSEPVRGGYGRA